MENLSFGQLFFIFICFFVLMVPYSGTIAQNISYGWYRGKLKAIEQHTQEKLNEIQPKGEKSNG